ncbi:MAG TPA: hypothetical protein VFY23_11160 [Candidatus Limnocylindrales bacterium]|nr:hypothetical protein [Candidatus Limnocylindrales bacterium]
MAVAQVARRRATIVSADAAGYSRLMAADELATIRTISVFREEGERVAGEHGGRLAGAPGDNLLFEFADAAGALQASLEFQAYVAAANELLPPDDRMHFRIGIHTGDVHDDGERLFGSCINIAARLERLARSGGVCISREVRDEVRDLAGGTPALEDIGEQHVKNIPHPVHAYFVDVPGQEIPVSRRASSGWPAIAVMPFETAEGDAEGEYLADGVAEEIITTLALWRQFPVIARNSTFTYKGRRIDPPAVARELGAEYLVVGSLRRAGDRVRISAQLLDCGGSQTLWADRWNTTFDELFDTTAELAAAITVAVRPELLKVMADKSRRQAPADMTAWDYAMHGLWHLHRLTKENGLEAVRLLTRAVELDPTSGFAHGHLAHAHYRVLQQHWTTDREADLRAVIAHAERAVSCDPMDATGHLYRSLALSVQGRRDEVIASLRRAVELNPSLPVARSLLGQFLGIAGRTEEGLAELDTAIRLSPRDPQLWSFWAGKSLVWFNGRRYAESRAASERVLEIEPNRGNAWCNIAATSALLGDLPRAREALAETMRVWPEMTFETTMTMFATIPAWSIREFWRGMRLAGYELTDEQITQVWPDGLDPWTPAAPDEVPATS